MLCFVLFVVKELIISDLCLINDSIKAVIATVQSYRCGYAESNLLDARKMEVMVIAAGLRRITAIKAKMMRLEKNYSDWNCAKDFF